MKKQPTPVLILDDFLTRLQGVMPGFTSSAWQAYLSRVYAAPCVVEGISWGVAPFFSLVAAPAISPSLPG